MTTRYHRVDTPTLYLSLYLHCLHIVMAWYILFGYEIYGIIFIMERCNSPFLWPRNDKVDSHGLHSCWIFATRVLTRSEPLGGSELNRLRLTARAVATLYRLALIAAKYALSVCSSVILLPNSEWGTRNRESILHRTQRYNHPRFLSSTEG